MRYLLLILFVSCQSAWGLEPRFLRSKTQPLDYPVKSDIVEVKFHEGSAVRLRSSQLVSLNGTQLSPVTNLLAHYPGLQMERMFFRFTEEWLLKQKTAGERTSGLELADLNLWYTFKTPTGLSSSDLARELNLIDIVELAYPAPIPQLMTPPPGMDNEYNFRTPDFTDQQEYLYSAPVGVEAEYSWSIAGGRGEQMKWMDVELGWDYDHEDLPEPFFTNSDDVNDHGTAVVGEVSGLENDFGITGIAPLSQAGAIAIELDDWPENVGQYFLEAYAELDPGDLFLIELHAPGPGGDYICMEYWQSNFDAIQTSTTNLVLCVEAAGNGGADFDNTIYEGLFDRNVRDSGAIIVGAGAPYTLARLDFSCYGSRLDCAGWGEQIVTTGYGDLWGGNTHEHYTGSFGGTSGASPMVVGAVLCLQGIVKAHGLLPLQPLAMRQLLTDTGSPQPDPEEYIGTRPNLETAYQELLLSFSDNPIFVQVLLPDDGEPGLVYDGERGLGAILYNNSEVDYSDLELLLRSDEPYLTFIDSLHILPLISPGEAVELTGAFTVLVSNDVPDDYQLELEIVMSDTSDSWSQLLSISALAPFLEIAQITINDEAGNNNHRPDPGELVTINISVANNGQALTPALTSDMTSENELILITALNPSLDPLEPQTSGEISYIVDISSDLPVGSLADMQLTVAAGAYGFSDSLGYVLGLLVETFNEGQFVMDWVHSGQQEWQIVEEDAQEGDYCTQSGDISHSQFSQLEITVEVTEPGELSFWARVSSESGYDYLTFKVDGSVQNQWAGELPWSQFSETIETGEHTFSWRYEKDGSVSDGADAAWLDYIVFPLTVDVQAVSQTGSVLPATLSLKTFPNPFNSYMTLHYSTGDNDDNEGIEIAVYNLLGKRIRTLVDEPQAVGEYTITWNGRDDYERELSSGLYFCSLRVGDRSVVQKITLLK
jgi:serine protease